ncbi:hypothetical protein EYZ11_007530 [Aspergillus tanneri]|nr:hypothetical protein EYZ11_007530 [Aspergillus tanneri]
MNGVAYNSIPPANYGITLPSYAKPPAYSRINSGSSTGIVPSASANHSKSQPLLHDAPASEPSYQKKDYTNSVASYLTVPPSINNSKGSLTEFAAQMTCLFWFESTAKLRAIEEHLNPVLSLVPEAIPSAGFQKWVTNILSTTQVSHNVILLALLFVYRLKKFNSGVRGKKGSEYRLVTIALMLGNKFLDDNTYTNKTWAEVSGISVQEIHIMEVEFLSNVRYNLFVSEEEWTQWHVKLGLFADFNNALVAPEKNGSPTPVLRISPSVGPSPRMQASPTSKLPSPPAVDSLHASTWNLPVNLSAYSNAPQFSNEIPQVNSRKRSRDEQVGETPSKRMAIPNAIPTPTSTLPPSSALTGLSALPPVLTPVSAPSTASAVAVSRLPRPSFPSFSHNLNPSIPASVPQITPSTSRAIPPLYNPNWASQVSPSTGMPPVTCGLYNNSLSLPDPARQHNSPFGVSSATVSPAISAYSMHTPQTNLSPSFFLANRNSPYRPVRNVNTLLIPPPSTFQQQRSVPFDHMHYQPLGKTAAERKTGLLPYLHSEAWPQGSFLPAFHVTPNYSN